jgi:toxin ParE1/3/4
MTVKAVVPTRLANTDIDAAIEFYLHNAGQRIALDFIDALEAAYGLLRSHPGAGSPRYDLELGLPGLRVLTVGKFPYLIFYVERPDAVDVWRVLHAQADVPTWMHGE